MRQDEPTVPTTVGISPAWYGRLFSTLFFFVVFFYSSRLHLVGKVGIEKGHHKSSEAWRKGHASSNDSFAWLASSQSVLSPFILLQDVESRLPLN